MLIYIAPNKSMKGKWQRCYILTSVPQTDNKYSFPATYTQILILQKNTQTHALNC